MENDNSLEQIFNPELVVVRAHHLEHIETAAEQLRGYGYVVNAEGVFKKDRSPITKWQEITILEWLKGEDRKYRETQYYSARLTTQRLEETQVEKADDIQVSWLYRQYVLAKYGINLINIPNLVAHIVHVELPDDQIVAEERIETVESLESQFQQLKEYYIETSDIETRRAMNKIRKELSMKAPTIIDKVSPELIQKQQARRRELEDYYQKLLEDPRYGGIISRQDFEVLMQDDFGEVKRVIMNDPEFGMNRYYDHYAVKEGDDSYKLTTEQSIQRQAEVILHWLNAPFATEAQVTMRESDFCNARVYGLTCNISRSLAFPQRVKDSTFMQGLIRKLSEIVPSLEPDSYLKPGAAKTYRAEVEGRAAEIIMEKDLKIDEAQPVTRIKLPIGALRSIMYKL